MKTEKLIEEKRKDEELRKELVNRAGYSIEEVPLVYQFIKGDDKALLELRGYEEWRLKNA